MDGDWVTYRKLADRLGSSVEAGDAGRSGRAGRDSAGTMAARVS
jgi:hypothetical protein